MEHKERTEALQKIYEELFREVNGVKIPICQEEIQIMARTIDDLEMAQAKIRTLEIKIHAWSIVLKSNNAVNEEIINNRYEDIRKLEDALREIGELLKQDGINSKKQALGLIHDILGEEAKGE